MTHQSSSEQATLITGIGELSTCDGTGEGGLGLMHDAALVVQSGRIAWVGKATEAPAADGVRDLAGCAVLPGFVDSHSHLVFSGDRSEEFVARMAGTAQGGGGISATRAATQGTSDEVLRKLVAGRIQEMRAQGTTTVEIKTGYGLTVDDEQRCAAVAAEFTSEVTYLGAHVVPIEYSRDKSAYLELATGPMLDAAAPHCKWIDVFCEPQLAHAFNAEESRAVLRAGADRGMGLRVHGNQLAHGPGVQVAVEMGAASVDHCTFLSDKDVAALVDARDQTVATLLPAVEFSTRSPYPYARALLDVGVSVALATDCNPGTSYSSSMPLVIALAVAQMGMTPAEAVVAATATAAKALRRDDIGRIVVGARADLTVLDAPSHRYLSYRPGVPLAYALEL